MVIVDRSYDPAIALQLMRGLYDGQQRPLTSKKDTKFHFVFVRILFSGNTNNLVRKTKSEPMVFLELLEGVREGSMVGKVILFLLFRISFFVKFLLFNNHLNKKDFL